MVDEEISENLSHINDATIYAGANAAGLEYVSKINANYVYKYGTATKSAAELTAENSARMMKIASRAKIAGKVVGIGGIVITGVQYYNGKISGVEASIDTIMTAVGIWGGLPGAIASLTYFGAKFLYEYSTGETLFKKP